MERKELAEKRKNYLKQYQNARNRESRIFEEIQRLRKDEQFPAVLIVELPKSTKDNGTLNYIALLEEEIRKLQTERLEKIELYREIEGIVKGIADDVEREALRLHYLVGLTWGEVANQMGFTHRHIMRIHSAALNHLKLP